MLRRCSAMFWTNRAVRRLAIWGHAGVTGAHLLESVRMAHHKCHRLNVWAANLRNEVDESAVGWHQHILAAELTNYSLVKAKNIKKCVEGGNRCVRPAVSVCRGVRRDCLSQ